MTPPATIPVPLRGTLQSRLPIHDLRLLRAGRTLPRVARCSKQHRFTRGYSPAPLGGEEGDRLGDELHGRLLEHVALVELDFVSAEHAQEF